jgi:hypothetical protein
VKAMITGIAVELLDVGKVRIPLTQTVIVDGKQFPQIVCRKYFGHNSRLLDHVCINTFFISL